MPDRKNVDALLRQAERTERQTVRLAQPGWLTSWRDRRLIHYIDEFMSALHHLSQRDTRSVTPEQKAEARRRIDAIVDAVERFLSAHPPEDRRGLERNQRLAGRIYELRRAFEAIARHVTPNPHMIDVRREEQLAHAHQWRAPNAQG